MEQTPEEEPLGIHPPTPAESAPSVMPDAALAELEAEELAHSASPAAIEIVAPLLALGDQTHDAKGRRIWTVGTLVYTLGGLVLLFCWLLWGDFALSMRDRSVGPLIEKFLLRNGTSNALKQLLTATLPTIIGLFLGPTVSYMSDRTRTRWGRRVPFLIFPTPIAGLAMIGIAFSPQMGQWLYRATGHIPAAGVSIYDAAANYTVGIFTVLWTIFEVCVIISGSVFGGLINDVVPRAVLGRFHGLFRAVSLFDGILFNAILFQHAENHFTLMFALIGVLFGGGFFLMCLKVREGDYPPPPAEEKNHNAAVNYLRECFTEPYYLLCFAMLILSALTFRPINDFTIRYAAQLGLHDDDYGFLVAISYVVSLILAYPLGLLVDKFHPLRLALLSIILYSLTALYGSLFVHSAGTFGVALIAHTILSGTYFTTSASLGQQLLPRARFSQYASAAGIVGSVVGLVYAPSIGAIIDLTKHQVIVNGASQTVYSYGLTFWGAFILSLASIIVTLLVYRRFMIYGGPKGYVAPGDAGMAPPVHEPPAHLTQTLLVYFAGAVVGIGSGYVLGYVVEHKAASKAGVGLTHFHALIMRNNDVRNMTTLCIATGVIPFAILGTWAGSYWAKKRLQNPQ